MQCNINVITYFPCFYYHLLISVSFEATRSSLTLASNYVTFDSVPVNHWSFNQQNSSFTAPVSSYYWLHISVAIPGNTIADVQLQGANRVIDIVRNDDSFCCSPDTTLTDAVVYLTNGTNVYMSSAYPLYTVIRCYKRQLEVFCSTAS